MRTLLTLLALSLAATSVHANDAEAKAQQLYGEGEAAYQAGNFDQALGSFMAAYDTAPVAGLLFNIGQCQRQLKRHELAVEYYQRYLKEETDVPNRKEIDDLIAEERALIPKGKTTLSTTPTPAAIASKAEDAKPGAPALWQQPLFWGVAGGAAIAVLIGATVAVVVATQPPAAQPSTTLGTFDLRSP